MMTTTTTKFCRREQMIFTIYVIMRLFWVKCYYEFHTIKLYDIFLYYVKTLLNTQQ